MKLSLSRRQFLKRGSLFVPAAFAGRALGQSLNESDGPFILKGGGCSGTATTAVAAWVARVVANGGATPSASSQAALCAFYDATTSIQSKILSLCMVVPDSVIASSTPFIRSAGNDPWTNNGGIAWDLTVNGIRATAANNVFKSGLVPSAVFANNTTAGMGCYVSVTHANDGGADTDMGCQNGTSQCCVLYTNFNSSFSAGQIYSNAGGGITSLTIGAGFWSVNAINSTTGAVYYGSSGTGFITAGAVGGPGNISNITGTRPTFDIWIMGQNSSGVPAGTSQVRRYSAYWVNQPFVLSEAQTLYNAIQACRVTLGGGYV